MNDVERIKADLLEVIDDTVMFHRRVEYWYRYDEVRLEIALGKVY